AERNNPTRDAMTQGHTSGREAHVRTKSGRHDELRRTDLPTVAAIVLQSMTTAFRSDRPVDRLESTGKTLRPARQKEPKFPRFRSDCQNCRGETGLSVRRGGRTAQRVLSSFRTL